MRHADAPAQDTTTCRWASVEQFNCAMLVADLLRRAAIQFELGFPNTAHACLDEAVRVAAALGSATRPMADALLLCGNTLGVPGIHALTGCGVQPPLGAMSSAAQPSRVLPGGVARG